LLADIPSTSIVRNVQKLYVMIVDIQYVKISLPTPEAMPKIVVLANV